LNLPLGFWAYKLLVGYRIELDFKGLGSKKSADFFLQQM
jgi:hypothetical protein